MSQKFSCHQHLDGQHRSIVRDQSQTSGWVFEAHNDNSCVFCEATEFRIKFLVLSRSGPKRKLWHWSNDQLTSSSLWHTVLGAHVGANRRPTAEDRSISFHYFIFMFQSEHKRVGTAPCLLYKTTVKTLLPVRWGIMLWYRHYFHRIIRFSGALELCSYLHQQR